MSPLAKRTVLAGCALLAVTAFQLQPLAQEITPEPATPLSNHRDADSDDEPDGGLEEANPGASLEGGAAVKPPSEPSPAPALDPALARLRSELSLLAKGKPPKSSGIDSLFNIPLDDPEMLKQRIKALPAEIAQLSVRIEQLKAQLGDRDRLVPEVERPAILDAAPVEPVKPAEPTPPFKPDREAVRAYLRQKRTAPTEDPRVVYKNALAQYEQALTRYTSELEAHEEKRAAFEQELALFNKAKAEHASALAERRRAVAAKVKELSTELANLQNRMTVARLRQSYLAGLAKMLGRLSEPGLEMFKSLKSPRTALRRRAESIEQITAVVRRLLERVRVLHRRAEAGSLLGFQVQRDEVAFNLSEEIQTFDNRVKKGRQLQEALLGLANEIESDSRAQRLNILVTAKSPNASKIIDNTFQTLLRESRRSSRVTTGFTVTDAELADLVAALDKLLKKPESLSTVSDGEQALLDIRAVGERLDKTLDAISLGLDRYRQAYKREIVTIYSSLASSEVKNRAYSFSYAFLEDFVADMNLLWVDLSLWAEDRLGSVSRLDDHIGTLDGQLRIARVGGGVILILLLMIARKRIRRRLAHVILRLINVKAFRRRAGLLVRLTVFVLALLPIALTALSGYALLFLIGIEYPEVRIAEIAFRWALFYFLGRQIVLGLTRKERTGRPPLLEVSVENFKLLRLTYARLGLFLVVAAAADEWSREWMGTGSFNSMVRFVASFWLGLWVLWAMAAWRRAMARACAARSGAGSVLGRVASFAEAHLAGVALAPFLFVWLFSAALFRAARKLMAEGNLLAYLRARTLRRLSRKTQRAESLVPSLALPEKYIEQFPLYPLSGEEGDVLLPRNAQMREALSQVEHWRSTKQDGSLVLVGEKGIGKTTFLALLEREIAGIRVTRHIFSKKLRSEQELVTHMCRGLDHDGTVADVNDLAEHLNAKSTQVILLDEAHNVFLRAVDGFRAVKALVNLVDATSDKVFWVLVFNNNSWSFLNRAKPDVRAFRRVLRLPPWSQDELKDLVARRNERSGLMIEFDEVLLDAETSSTGGFELISSADGFFRLLWEASRGNPRVATYIWLNALTALSDKRIRVGLMREESSEFLTDLDTGMLFALASFAQHENLSFEELSRALNISSDEAGYAARYLLEYGLLEPKHTDATRFTLAPRFHQQVIRTLRERHLLYREA